MLLALLAGELCLAGWYGHRKAIYKFDVVRAGILYRSGQPEGENWDRLATLYNVKTVIDLREIVPTADWSVEQDAACEKYGIKLVHIEMLGRDEPPTQDWQKFLDITNDPNNWPVLVHCEMGTSRTGVIVGCYRITQQGWTPTMVSKEAVNYYFKPEKHPAYLKFWRDLFTARKKSLQASSAPASTSVPTTIGTQSNGDK